MWNNSILIDRRPDDNITKSNGEAQSAGWMSASEVFSLYGCVVSRKKYMFYHIHNAYRLILCDQISCC